MAVSVAASSPPVQDSAVAIVAPCGASSVVEQHGRLSDHEPASISMAIGHGRLTVAVAMAAIPSPLPMKPSPSLVVALMLIWPDIEAEHGGDASRASRRDEARCVEPRR